MSRVEFGLVQVTWTRTSRRNLDIGTRRTAIHAKCMEKRTVLQGRPQPVINWIISPISRFINPVTHLFAAIYKGPITRFITILGALCNDFHYPKVESTSKKLPAAAPRRVESSKCWWFLPDWWEELFPWSQGVSPDIVADLHVSGWQRSSYYHPKRSPFALATLPHYDWIEWNGQPTSSGVFKRAPFIKIVIDYSPN